MINMAGMALFFSWEEFITLKKSIAQILYEDDVEQSKISKILGLSQPMVSNYCGSNKTEQKDILQHAIIISKQIKNKQKVQFQNCVTFSDKPVSGTQYIADKNELIDDENRAIVDNLKKAFLMIKNKNLSGFIPKIKINIVHAKNHARSPEDIAAFVNGFIIADNSIIGNNGIRFGCSKHLTSLLLNLQKKLKINAMMNISYQDTINEELFTVEHLKKDFELRTGKKPIDILLHKGDFGIEPCTYILGNDALDVSNKLMGLINGDASL